MTNYARSDVYPPEVEALGDMSTCSDETHADGCPCQSGGDVLVRCWLCRRVDDGAGINVTAEGRVEWICSYCEDRYADEVRIPLSYEEDDDDDGN